ncbi:MAG: acetyltransferase [Motiliproteus sp.]|nr:acetyltransferase [Motiliproteus sp.]MCW9054331.1 acetyltransferase [Motiliproteus sp.]
MKRLLIAGLGGMGRELYEYLLDDQKKGHLAADLEIAGIDDSPVASLHPDVQSICRGKLSDYQFDSDEFVLLAIGNAQLRRTLTEKLAANGANFFTYVHSSCFVAKTAQIDEGCVISAHSIVNADAHVGAHTLVNAKCNVAHDSRLGRYSVLSPFCAVNGNAVAGEALFMGTHSTLYPGVTLGNDCAVSAHSYVKEDVGDGVLVYSAGRCQVTKERR